MIRIQKAEGKGKRILAVSDVHGEFDLLYRLLKKADYREGDILIIVGDILDKGRENLRTLQYVRELCGKPDVYLTLGNVEYNRIQLLSDLSETGCKKIFAFMKEMHDFWGGCLFEEMLSSIGIAYAGLNSENIQSALEKMTESYAKEIEFLKELPAAVECGNYFFVHGGLQSDERPDEDADPMPILKNDAFLEHAASFSKTLVVGHWPVFLYRKDQENGNPFFSKEKNVIAIDGGCALKKAGQLNLLLIPHDQAAMEEISFCFCDNNPAIRALEDQKEKAPSVHIQYGKNRVRILGEEEEFLTAEYEFPKQTKEQTFFNEPVSLAGENKKKACIRLPKDWFYVPYEADRTEEAALPENRLMFCEDYIDAELPVKAGEELSLLWESSDGVYVKKDGMAGWYRKSWERVPEKFSRLLGRPDNLWPRREREAVVYQLLDRLGIAYERIDHREVNTMGECEAVDRALDAVICKNLFLRNRQKTAFYLLMIPAEKHLAVKELSGQLGISRLSFAESFYMEEILHITPGSLSVMGLMNDKKGKVRLLIDEDVLRAEYFGCHPCMNTSSIRMKVRDLTERFLPEIGHEFTAVRIS